MFNSPVARLRYLWRKKEAEYGQEDPLSAVQSFRIPLVNIFDSSFEFFGIQVVQVLHAHAFRPMVLSLKSLAAQAVTRVLRLRLGSVGSGEWALFSLHRPVLPCSI